MTEELDLMLAKARKAQEIVEYWSQEQVDEMVLAVGWEAYKRETAETAARIAVEETGLGVYEDKVAKNQKKALSVTRDLMDVKTVGVIERIPKKGLLKVAKPVGIIGAVTPMTNARLPCRATDCPSSKRATRSYLHRTPRPRKPAPISARKCARACARWEPRKT